MASRPLNPHKASHRKDSVSRFGVRETAVSGRILIQPAGETDLDVPFPVMFTEQPIMTFGWEIAESSHLTPQVEDNQEETGFPITSAYIARWIEREHNKGLYYVGANIATKISIPFNLSNIGVILHWRAEGKAIQAPSRFGEV